MKAAGTMTETLLHLNFHNILEVASTPVRASREDNCTRRTKGVKMRQSPNGQRTPEHQDTLKRPTQWNREETRNR